MTGRRSQPNPQTKRIPRISQVPAKHLCSDIEAITRLSPDTIKLQNWRMANLPNIVDPQVRKLPYHQGLKQEALAARGGVLGWDLSRGTLSKIEARLRCVTNAELEVLAKALRVEIAAWYPGKRGSKNGRR